MGYRKRHDVWNKTGYVMEQVGQSLIGLWWLWMLRVDFSECSARWKEKDKHQASEEDVARNL